MLEARIIMLGATGTGAIFGALFALTVPTAMKAGPEPTWRDSLPRPRHSSESYRYVETGPIDAGPRRWLDPPMPEIELPAYTVPDYTEELAEVAMQDSSAELAAAEAAEAAAAARLAEAATPVAPPETWTPQPEPHPPLVESPPVIVITLPDVPGPTS